MARAIDSEAAYRFLSKQLVKETGAFSKGVNKGINIARSAMRNPDAIPTLTPPNELTIEQLLEMDGEWVMIKVFDREISGTMPAIIKDKFATTLYKLGARTVVPDLCEAHFPFSEYRKTWLAYRRPPEGEEDAATAIETLRADLARVTAERDAAVSDINEILPQDELCPLLCEWCAWHDDCDGKKAPKWRSIKEG